MLHISVVLREPTLNTIGKHDDDWIAPPAAIAVSQYVETLQKKASYETERDPQWSILRDQLVKRFDVACRNNELRWQKTAAGKRSRNCGTARAAFTARRGYRAPDGGIRSPLDWPMI